MWLKQGNREFEVEADSDLASRLLAEGFEEFAGPHQADSSEPELASLAGANSVQTGKEASEAPKESETRKEAAKAAK